MRLGAAILAAAAMFPAAAMAAGDASIDEAIVYVECTTPEKRPRRGSGVMISPDGLLLTAKHVVFGKADDLPDGTVCKGVVGDAGLPMAELIVQDHSGRYDAALLKMPAPPGGTFKSMRYCRLTPRLLRAGIFATGFPLDSATRKPSSRAGVLATVQPDRKGLIETDSQTTTGMSGGMVTLGLSGALVGLVTGLETDPENGLPKTYVVLAVDVLAKEFRDWGLTEKPAEDCPPQRLTDEVVWSSGAGPQPLGMTEGEGFCFITGTFGRFDHPNDKVVIELDPAAGYRLTGDSGGNGPHAGAARCVRF